MPYTMPVTVYKFIFGTFNNKWRKREMGKRERVRIIFFLKAYVLK